jgi:hypothetical protein
MCLFFDPAFDITHIFSFIRSKSNLRFTGSAIAILALHQKNTYFSLRPLVIDRLAFNQ